MEMRLPLTLSEDLDTVSVVSARLTSQQALSQLCAHFHSFSPRSLYRGCARVDNLGIKLVSAGSILKKERNGDTCRMGASLMDLTFSSVG